MEQQSTQLWERRARRGGTVLLAFWLAVASASILLPASEVEGSLGEPLTRLFLDGEPGASVTGGQQYVLDSFSAYGYPSSVWFTRNAYGPPYVSVHFSAPAGEDLTVGVYENASRSHSTPGLDLGVEGKGCNTASGRFIVDQISFDSDNVLSAFSARFEFHCEQQDPAVFGAISYNGTSAFRTRTFSSPSLKFSSTVPGSQSDTMHVTLSNQGPSPLNVTNLITGADAGQFEITSNSCELAVLGGGSSCSVGVRYMPRSSGAHEAKLTFFDELSPSGGGGTGRDVPLEGVAETAFGEFTSLTPFRILDTRVGTGRGGLTVSVGAGQSIDVQVTGRGGVPSTGVSAVVMNVTVTEPTAPSFLTVWPTGLPLPEISNLNYMPGQTVPNLVTVAVGTGGKLSAFNAFGSAHVIFDVVGFYADATGPPGSRFHAIDPYRYFDTREGSGGVGLGPLGPDSTLKFKATGVGGVPSGGVSAVVMNVTVTQPTRPSYLTVYPGDVAAPPNASNLNYWPGVTVPNLVAVRVPASGIVNFYNRFGSVHLLADVVGYYDDDKFTEAGRFVGLAPSRIFDSRVDFTEPFFEDSGTTLPIAGYSGVPLSGAGAAVLNVTATQTTAPGYVTVFPDDVCGIPLASNLNFGPGQTVPNLVMVRIASPGGCADPTYPGGVYLYNRFGYTHLIVDLFGYFTDASSYDEFTTVTDDTGTISVDVPVEWNDILSVPVGVPPEPSVTASPDFDIFFNGWDVPGVSVRVSRTAATTYPTPADYLASFGPEFLADECATTGSGPYDDGTYVGNFVSAERCGAGNKAGFLMVAAQAAGTDYYLRIVFTTITQRDLDAVDGVIASLEVDPSF